MLKKGTPLWREARFQVKFYKTLQLWNTLGIEMSKNCTRLWREAHVKVKSTKHTMIGALLEVAMLKKRTLLWHEAHFEVKMVKTPHAGITYGGSDVEKVHTVAARSTFRS